MFAANKTAGVSIVANYIEDVFSTYLYMGNGSTQTITNGLDLSTYGGLVWLKNRDSAPSNNNNNLVDTTRGISAPIYSNSTSAQLSQSTIASFNTTGFSMGAFGPNEGGTNYVSWTFREQPKFFDVVTYTGDGSLFQTVSHNLGSEPGCIIVKQTNSGSTNWVVYHRITAIPNQETLRLNLANAKTGAGGGTIATSTSIDFYGNGGSDPLNASGGTYVAYLFAHNAGGFGPTGTDNVISCGGYTGNGSATGPVISLGYEPQWLMVKNSTGTGNWNIIDNMRGMSVDSGNNYLIANTSDSDSSSFYVSPTATGFQITTTATEVNTNASIYIYIAIRRGPMKVPTVGTSVFSPIARTGTDTNQTITSGQTDDAVLVKNRGSAVASLFSSRLTKSGYLVTSSTAAEVAAATTILQANPWDVMDGVKVGTTSTITNASANTYINYLLKRAPSFFDEVCYTGTGISMTVAHNLAAVPELIIVKCRSGVTAWQVYSSALANTEYVVLNTTAAKATGATRWNSTTPTSSVFNLGTASEVNTLAATYVAYLFATCPGVSKVGSYTGNGTTQTINCGFTGGARFVLIKRTDAIGDWYTYDTARGMTTMTDPYLLLNSAVAETATLGSVTTVSTGFALNSTILAAINVSAGTYIFLAIA